MSFASFSLVWVAAGLAGLAALLAAMQWLRVRYREVAVITTIFWREALEEAPARVFRQHFRHWPAYLLILAICAAMWFALAGPQWHAGKNAEHFVLLLDGSAHMARGDRFKQAVAQLRRDAGRLDEDTREVLWVGGSVKTLLAPGEQTALLDKRLEKLAPQATSSVMDRTLQQLATIQHPGQRTVLRIYGDAPVGPQVLRLMPATHRVVRATETPKADLPNAGITALGVGEASSGRWNRVDALIHAQGTPDGNVGLRNLDITLNGAPLKGVQIQPVADGAFLLKDLPAEGGLLQVKLRGNDALALDNVASVSLPRRALIKVQLSPSLEAALGPVLEVDPAVQRTNQNPDVVIRRRDENLGAGRPALVFAPMATQPAAFSLIWPDEAASSTEEGDDRLAGAMQALGLGQIDATALAQATQRPIEITVKPGRQRVFFVWEELLLNDYNFTRSRSFPVFIAESVRWLAKASAWYPYIATGQPLPQANGTERAPFVNAQDYPIDTLGAAFVPEQGGSLLDPQITLSRRGGVNKLGEPGPLPLGHAVDPVTLLLLLALLLLSLEWLLYQKGRLP